jgi:hypothetical protein
MMCTFHGQSGTYTVVCDAINWFFGGVFTIEAFMKLSALGRAYFDDPWNVFDCFLVTVNNCGILFMALGIFDLGTLPSVLRTFRVARVIRLVKKWQGLRTLFTTLFVSLPAMMNIVALLMLILLIYGVWGVQLFAKAPFGEFITPNANFRDVFQVQSIHSILTIHYTKGRVPGIVINQCRYSIVINQCRYSIAVTNQGRVPGAADATALVHR